VEAVLSRVVRREVDILVGTQMVTKGLDFDRVSVVGILNADALISFPDFRAFERAFQLLSQVSGRAGRREVPGKVVIQAFQPNHPALKFVETNDFFAMYQSQIAERQQFRLPPITRMIKVTLKHPEEQTVLAAAIQLQGMLREVFPGMVMGPAAPLVSRIQNYYLQDFWLKFPRDHSLSAKKQQLAETLKQFKQISAYKKIRCVINVDA
jgi:primosomal protein N' (replication factor Y)